MPIDRYHRQTLLPQVGVEGQARLRRARVLLVGCGALGGVIAEQLVRAGVGSLIVADRDVVELTNLQRQVLFDEEDVHEQTPKAVAAARKLGRINSEVRIDPRVVDVHAGNIEELAGIEPGGLRVDLILDGTDNVDTRYLINDVSIKHGIPWVYGGCVGTEGRCMAVRPSTTPCLRCIFPTPAAAGELPTCDTAGVLGPAAAVVASLQVTAALRLLIDPPDGIQTAQLISVDVWQGRFRTLALDNAKDAECPCCGQQRFEFLEGRPGNGSTSLCGRNAVQVRPTTHAAIDLQALGAKLDRLGKLERTPYLLRCSLHDPRDINLTVFPDGRVIVHGTANIERAKSIYARFLGN